jgi:asparagine synthase (glutamine-hydrolysing)
MSRIAAVLSSAVSRPLEQVVRTILARERSSTAWRDITETIEGIGAGWCGWHTPNVYRGQGLVVAVDGLFYNRHELPAAHTDAEAIGALYRHHGFEGALQRINGDFAAILGDAETRTLWLGRDRFGVKPLYYVSTPDLFAAASRPGGLLHLPGVSRAVNREFVGLVAACHYRYFDNAPTRSPFRDIAQLPPAHALCVTDRQIRSSCYWRLTDQPDWEESETSLAERYRELLTSAVALRLNRVSRPAFTLSGGMDSSSVLATAVGATGSRQHAFSSVYSDKTYDESDEIRSMLQAAVNEWHPVEIGTPDVPAIVSKMIAVHDEPVATATWLSHYLLCAAVARQGFGALFGGLGGDELNAGEHEYFVYHFADLQASGCDDVLAREIEQWIRHHDHPVFKKSLHVVDEAFSRLVDRSGPGRCLPDRRRLTRYAAVIDPEYFDLDKFEPVMEHPFSSCLKNRAYQDLTRETAPCCLRAEDRQTTAFGLDHLLPFLDYRLVEFMFRVPGRLKIRDGVMKYLLRQAMRGVLPEETRTRVKKTGWNAPAHVWFAGRGAETIRDLIGSGAFRGRGIYRIEEVERLLREHDEIVSNGRPVENHMMFFWQLLNLELWFQWKEQIAVDDAHGRHC